MMLSILSRDAREAGKDKGGKLAADVLVVGE